jgi:hypothetical protein
MESDNLINVEDFCQHHQVDISFIRLLSEHGLVEITTIEQTHYLTPLQLRDVEKMTTMHYDLDINLEGIEVICQLLGRINNLHEEVNQLRNRLARYE